MIHTPANETPHAGPEYLCETYYFDSGNPVLRAAVEKVCAGAGDDVERAVRLFYWVRDGWRYDPFKIRISSESHVASAMLDSDHGYCVSKAILLCAAARVAGIPSAIGLANVTNHLTSEKLKRWMGGSTVFVNHGYAMLHVAGKWVKTVPAFNIDMCKRFGVAPTEFDGRHDALLQEFDQQQRRHMEYLVEHGVWSDFPFERFAREMREAYSNLGVDDSAADTEFVPDRSAT